VSWCMYVRLMAGNVMTGYAFLEVSKGGGLSHHQVDKKFHANAINL